MPGAAARLKTPESKERRFEKVVNLPSKLPCGCWSAEPFIRWQGNGRQRNGFPDFIPLPFIPLPLPVTQCGGLRCKRLAEPAAGQALAYGRPKFGELDGAEQTAGSRVFSAVEDWSGRRDSNSRPLAPQASALAGLRYAPTEIGIKPAQIVAGHLRVSMTKICKNNQTPNNQTPNTKLQTPNSKLQRNSNVQAPNPGHFTVHLINTALQPKKSN